MTTFEILEIALSLRDDPEDQFEFWLSITFAVIVSSFVGGARILPSWRAVIGVLYLLSTLLLSVRFVMSGQNFNSYISEAISRGAVWADAANTMYTLRLSVLLFGTLATAWFLYANSKNSAQDT